MSPAPRGCHLSRAPESPGSTTAQQPTDVPHVGTVVLPGAIGDEAMTTNEPELGPGLGPRKPHAQLRHWSTYTSVGEWYADYRG